MSDEQIYDSFPSTILTDSRDFKFISHEKFRANSPNLFPFILFKNAYNILQFYALINPQNIDRKHMNVLEPRFERLIYSCTNRNAKTGIISLEWKRIDRILKKEPRLGHLEKRNRFKKRNPTEKREGNADTRLGFRWNNQFAVKRFFTFGERKTDEKEVHIIQTTTVPLLFHVPHNRYKNNIFQNHRPGQFRYQDQKMYQVYILNPWSIYLIPSNTIYILISVQKTFFALDRITAKLSNELRLSHGILYKKATSEKQRVVNELEFNRKLEQEHKKILMSSTTSVDNAIEWEDASRSFVTEPETNQQILIPEEQKYIISYQNLTEFPEFVQQEITFQPEYLQQEITSQPEYLQQEIISQPEHFQQEIISQPEYFQQEIISQPEHLQPVSLQDENVSQEEQNECYLSQEDINTMLEEFFSFDNIVS